MFFHMYIAPGGGGELGGGGRQPFVDKILSTEKPCHFAHLLQVSNISLKSDFIRNFSCFYTCI